jgi:hypothetical protein
MSQFIAQKSKQDQAIKLAALQAAQKKEERGLETALAQDKTRFDFAMEVLKAEAKKKNYELLSSEEARKLGLPLDRNQVYQRERGTNDISPIGSPTTIIQMPPVKKPILNTEKALVSWVLRKTMKYIRLQLKPLEKLKTITKQLSKYRRRMSPQGLVPT